MSRLIKGKASFSLNSLLQNLAVPKELPIFAAIYKKCDMSTAILMGLRDYLYGTLSPNNMRWLATQLTEYAEKEEYSLRPFTMEELNTRIDEAEADIAAGRVIDDEDVWRELEEEFACEDAEENARRAVSYVDELQLEAV